MGIGLGKRKYGVFNKISRKNMYTREGGKFSLGHA